MTLAGRKRAFPTVVSNQRPGCGEPATCTLILDAPDLPGHILRMPSPRPDIGLRSEIESEVVRAGLW
jgi:hypothetical protein